MSYDYILHKGNFQNIKPNQWQTTISNDNGSGRILSNINGTINIIELNKDYFELYNNRKIHILQNILNPLYLSLLEKKTQNPIITKPTISIKNIILLLVVFIIIILNLLYLNYR